MPLQLPNLQSHVKPVVEQAIRRLYEFANSVDVRLSEVSARPVALEQDIPTPAQVSADLQASGRAPLNVSGLIGVLSNPQRATIPEYTALPDSGDPNSQDGVAILLNGQIYRFDQSSEPGQWSPIGTVLYQGTHADRIASYPATNYSVGTLFFEIDRTVYYIVLDYSGSKKWWFFTGKFRSLLSFLPTDLGPEDIEFRFYAIDYRHSWRWGSTIWTYDRDNGDRQSGEFATFASDPGIGWALCDGSIVTTSLDDGTTTSFTTPDLTGDIAILGGSYDAVRRPAARAKWEATAKTETKAHEHPFGPFDVVSADDSGSGTEVQSGTGVVVASHPHSHMVTMAGDSAFEDPAHYHDLTDTNALLKVPSETNGGVPIRMALQWYVRL